ncbi:hypothetical protein AMV237 [Betaentomopoxvirus amoorei]|uniref:AMV237 n=1 Tax=Amsacta moorei entomopoxvirus TaxID=28321 RepID=Q9EMG9_AMEPV|nr:hypothetical protein AMV237 [Amsacta moorei entomopoxvirus]AAG02943.1 AMV237 [Amsacta moorei entomopoxvirus]
MEKEQNVADDVEDIDDKEYDEILKNIEDEKNELKKKEYTEGLLRLIFKNIKENVDKNTENENNDFETEIDVDKQTEVQG